MRFLRTAAVVLALVFTLATSATPAFGQQKQTSESFWATGNTFLSWCDEDGANLAQLSSTDKQTWITLCNVWVSGVSLGSQVVQQLRPEPTVSREVQELNDEELKRLKKLGLRPGSILRYPRGNLCIPSSAPTNQLRLVVVRWMKTNPAQLGWDAATLTYAALADTYACPAKKGG
ncbi:MAG TPA: Rap1a/Tai family immunity protein [Patescibacteria group bacterium]|nr:Rap1a/Tai family immunity protein [Patescibacteria group bacterium]